MADRSYLQWPFFEDRHRALAEALETWVSNHDWPHASSEQEPLDAASRANVTALGEAGWLRHCVIAPHGGAGPTLDVRTLCLHRDILARHSGLADFAFAMQGLGSGPICLFGNDDQRARYLPRVATGEAVAAFAISEANAGSDVAAMSTTAVEDGDVFVLDGEKTWISNGGIADQYVVFARTGEHPTRGISAFIVEPTDPGFSVPERIDTIAPHPLGTLRFEACRVPRSRLLGAPGQGFKIAMATLDIFRSTVGAAALGMARRALDEALARSQSRSILGKPLFEQQMTQAKIAEMAVDVDASALLIYRAAWTKDTTGARISREAAMAKLHATERAQQVIDKAVQLWGGMGVVSGTPVEELYREIRALRIYEGTSEVQKLIIARQVLAQSTKQESGG
jgi:acyl-CoA dehydrogenase